MKIPAGVVVRALGGVLKAWFMRSGREERRKLRQERGEKRRLQREIERLRGERD